MDVDILGDFDRYSKKEKKNLIIDGVPEGEFKADNLRDLILHSGISSNYKDVILFRKNVISKTPVPVLGFGELLFFLENSKGVIERKFPLPKNEKNIKMLLEKNLVKVILSHNLNNSLKDGVLMRDLPIDVRKKSLDVALFNLYAVLQLQLEYALAEMDNLDRYYFRYSGNGRIGYSFSQSGGEVYDLIDIMDDTVINSLKSNLDVRTVMSYDSLGISMFDLKNTFKDIEVDELLADKRIHIFYNNKDLPEETFLRSLCYFYDLKFLVSNGKKKITFNTYDINDIDSVFFVLWSLLPNPIKKFIEGYVITQNKYSKNNYSIELQKTDIENIRSALNRLSLSAYVELVYRIEEKMKLNKSMFIKGSVFSDREKMLYLFLKIKGIFSYICGGYFENPPEYADFLESRIKVLVDEVEVKGNKLTQADILFEKFVPAKNRWRVLLETGGIITMIGEKL